MADPLFPETTPLLELPFILPAQAQKHVPYNEALRRLDLLVQLAVASRSLAEPPVSPPVGARYLVPAGASGAFAGQAGHVALWEGAAWAFFAPGPGWRAEVLEEEIAVVFDGAAWRDESGATRRFAALGLGTPAQGGNGLALAAPASLFTHAGGGHQLKINKASPGDTASLLFQTGWSGRAEMGTTGSDRFAIKVSADGASFQTALELDPDSARVALPQGARLGAGSASLPALAFAGDATSGIWQPGPGQLALSGGGVERLRLGPAALQLNLPLTGSALAQSPEDLTPGRLPVQGWMGLGLPLEARSAQAFEGFAHAGFIANSAPGDAPSDAPGAGRHAGISLRAGGTAGGQILISEGGTVYMRAKSAGVYGAWAELRTSLNTTIDSNGFLKEASPVLRLYEDRPDPAAPGWLRCRRLGPGRHEIAGSAGLAQEGWQIELPRDLNANPLLAVTVTFTEGRLMLQAGAPQWQEGRLAPGAPLEIPAGRFIALRFAPPPSASAAAAAAGDPGEG